MPSSSSQHEWWLRGEVKRHRARASLSLVKVSNNAQQRDWAAHTRLRMLQSAPAAISSATRWASPLLAAVQRSIVSSLRSMGHVIIKHCTNRKKTGRTQYIVSNIAVCSGSIYMAYEDTENVINYEYLNYDYL